MAENNTKHIVQLIEGLSGINDESSLEPNDHVKPYKDLKDNWDKKSGNISNAIFYRNNYENDAEIQATLDTFDFYKGHTKFSRRDSNSNSFLAKHDYYNNFRAAIFTTINPDTANKHSFISLPIIPQEGDTLHKRVQILKHTINFCSVMGLKKPRVLILTGTRKVWRGTSASANIISREAEMLINWINVHYVKNNQKGISVELVTGTNHPDLGFELDEAIRKYHFDILVYYDGITGNMLSREWSFQESNRIQLFALPWFAIPHSAISENIFSDSTKKSLYLPIGEAGFKEREKNSNNQVNDPYRRSHQWYLINQKLNNREFGGQPSKTSDQETKNKNSEIDELRKEIVKALVALSGYDLGNDGAVNPVFRTLQPSEIIHYLPLRVALKKLEEIDIETFQRNGTSGNKVKISINNDLLKKTKNAIQYESATISHDEQVSKEILDSSSLIFGIGELSDKQKYISRPFINRLPLWGLSLSNTPFINSIVNKTSSNKIRAIFAAKSSLISIDDFANKKVSILKNLGTVHRLFKKCLNQYAKGRQTTSIYFSYLEDPHEFDDLFSGAVDIALTLHPWLAVQEAALKNKKIDIVFNYLGQSEELTSLYFKKTDNTFLNNVLESILSAIHFLVQIEINHLYSGDIDSTLSLEKDALLKRYKTLYTPYIKSLNKEGLARKDHQCYNNHNDIYDISSCESCKVNLCALDILNDSRIYALDTRENQPCKIDAIVKEIQDGFHTWYQDNRLDTSENRPKIYMHNLNKDKYKETSLSIAHHERIDNADKLTWSDENPTPREESILVTLAHLDGSNPSRDKAIEEYFEQDSSINNILKLFSKENFQKEDKCDLIRNHIKSFGIKYIFTSNVSAILQHCNTSSSTSIKQIRIKAIYKQSEELIKLDSDFWIPPSLFTSNIINQTILSSHVNEESLFVSFAHLWSDEKKQSLIFMIFEYKESSNQSCVGDNNFSKTVKDHPSSHSDAYCHYICLCSTNDKNDKNDKSEPQQETLIEKTYFSGISFSLDDSKRSLTIKMKAQSEPNTLGGIKICDESTKICIIGLNYKGSEPKQRDKEVKSLGQGF